MYCDTVLHTLVNVLHMGTNFVRRPFLCRHLKRFWTPTAPTVHTVHTVHSVHTVHTVQAFEEGLDHHYPHLIRKDQASLLIFRMGYRTVNTVVVSIVAASVPHFSLFAGLIGALTFWPLSGRPAGRFCVPAWGMHLPMGDAHVCLHGGCMLTAQAPPHGWPMHEHQACVSACTFGSSCTPYLLSHPSIHAHTVMQAYLAVMLTPDNPLPLAFYYSHSILSHGVVREGPRPSQEDPATDVCNFRLNACRMHPGDYGQLLRICTGIKPKQGWGRTHLSRFIQGNES